jgi:glycine hydroxymethyltransferase
LSPSATPFPQTPTAPGTPAASGSAPPALTTRGFGAAEFDRIAELVVDVLTNTQPQGASKAKYTQVDGTAERVQAAADELLAANPLYAGLTM